MDAEAAKLIVSVVALLVSAGALAISTFSARKVAVAGRRPVLVFDYDSSRGWCVRNVGTGAALDVLIAQKVVGGSWVRPVRIPPLGKDGEFPLLWCLHVNDKGLGAYYRDVGGLDYSSHCGDDLTRVAKGSIFPKWSRDHITPHWAAVEDLSHVRQGERS